MQQPEAGDRCTHCCKPALLMHVEFWARHDPGALPLKVLSCDCIDGPHIDGSDTLPHVPE